MTLVKNLNILPNLFLFQKGLDMMFDGILDKKEENPWFWSKSWNLFQI